MQCIRTVSWIKFEFVTFTEPTLLYQKISAQAYQLHLLGMSYAEIGRALGIDDETAKKAVLFTRRN